MGGLFYGIAACLILFNWPERPPLDLPPALRLGGWALLCGALYLLAIALLRNSDRLGRTRRGLLALNLAVAAVSAHLLGLAADVGAAMQTIPAALTIFAGFLLQTAPLLLLLRRAESRVMDVGRPAAYLAFHLRQYAFAAAPFALISGLMQAATQIRAFAEPLTVWPSLWFLPLFVVVLLFFVLAPLALRFILPARPLPTGPLRSTLERLAGAVGVRVRQIYVWRTRPLFLPNASVAGVLPQLRYVFVTDALLEFPDDEVAAVFAHELGHARLWHPPLYMCLAASFGAFTMWLDRALPAATAVASVRLGVPPEALAAAAVLAALALFWLVFFGWVSRRFEQAADLFAAETVGAAPFVNALARIEVRHGASARAPLHWRHFPVPRRIAVLRAAASDPSARRAVVNSTTTALVLVGIVTLTLLGFYLWCLLDDFALPHDVILYRRAVAAARAGDLAEAEALARRAHRLRPDSETYSGLLEWLRKRRREDAPRRR